MRGLCYAVILNVQTHTPLISQLTLTASPPRGEAAQLNHRLFFMSKQALYRGFRIVYHRLVGTEKEFRLTKPGKDAL
jgi:hypothetical protein